jgi:chromate transporter
VTDTPDRATNQQALAEVARVSLKLGFTAFGGPAAHIAMLRDEAVIRRRWLEDSYFLDLIGATNLVPGPNSTEMVMHIGQLRAGWRGLIVGGTCFILPAASIVLILAWVYVRYSSTPELEHLMYGIKPVIIAIVAQAIYGLVKTAIKGPLLAIVALAALGLYLLGLNELVVLFGGALLVLLLRRLLTLRHAPIASFLPVAGFPLPFVNGSATQAAVEKSVSLLTLFLLLLKTGAVLYGSGYVLLAFLRNDFVVRYGWLTDQQLLDAVAIGQFTPGPVFTTATFVGYVVAGFPGAILATIGIFLPAFIFVAMLRPLVPRLRRSAWTASLLDGVNVAALGLMAAVAWQLGREAIVDWLTVVLAAGALLVLIRFPVNSAWLVLAGAIVGILSWVL